MPEKMVNNTYRPDKEETIKLYYIGLLDPRVENDSMAIRYAFAYAAENGIDFAKAKAYRHKNYVNYEPLEYGKAKSYCAVEDDFNNVVEKFKEKYKPEVVRISYLTRLVTSNYLMFLVTNKEPEEKTVKIKTKTIDGIDLLKKVNNRAAELIKAGELDAVLAFISEEV